MELLLGSDPLELPTPLDDLVRRLLDRQTANSRSTASGQWVFPGRPRTHHISTWELKTRLARLGIHGRTGRNTALFDLAAQLPPVVLARMLGINITTVGAWAGRAGGSHAA